MIIQKWIIWLKKLGYKGYWLYAEDSDLIDVISINCLSMAMMTKIVIPKLMKRDKKSAVINLSSIAANTPSSIYAATKKFNDFFSRSLS